MNFEAVIFDLDGVIVSTDNNHYSAWKKIADEEGFSFDRKLNEKLRGVSRLESLNIIIRNCHENISDSKKRLICDKKNSYYIELIKNLSKKDILPGVIDLIDFIKQNNKKVAIGSSSKNCKLILTSIGMIDAFDIIVDGNDIKKSKPDPEVFLTAAINLNVNPARCLVIEDANAGVEAAISAGMHVLAIGNAASCKKAHYSFENLTIIPKVFLEYHFKNESIVSKSES